MGCRRRLRHVLPAVAVASAAGLATPGSALGHAAFVGSQPGPGARVEASPGRVVVAFTEPLNRGLSRAVLTRAGGRDVPASARASGDRRLELTPRSSLATGAYRVRWHTVSTEDGHALEGSFSFGVRAPAAGGAHELEQSPLARSGWVRVALRMLMYVAVLLFAAALLIPVVLRQREGSWLVPDALHGQAGLDVEKLRERERGLTLDIGWLSVGSAAGVTLAEAADAAGGVSATGLREFLFSNAAGVARVVLSAALLLAVVLAARRRVWAAACVAVALFGIAASGHASSASPRLPTIGVDWLHLLGGAVWLGGMGLLALVWGPALRSGGREVRLAAARHVLPGFGRAALPAFGLVAATGVTSLLVQLGHLDALWTTAYGRILVVKVALVALIAAISAVHVWRLRPRLLAGGDAEAEKVDRRHWRLVRGEPLVGLGVLGAVALLVAFPLPPRQLREAGEALARAPACDPCPLRPAAADELSVADLAGSQLVAAWIRRSGDRLTGTVRVLDVQGRPSRAAVDLPGAGQRDCGRGCLRFSASAGPLRVAVRDRGRRFVTALPTRWDAGASASARALLARSLRAMRALRSVRQEEVVTSGPGAFARVRYRLRAPDRMAYETNLGGRTVVVGKRQWFRTGDAPWRRGSYGAGLPFSVRRWFRWSAYARVVRLLGRRRDGDRTLAELALMDPAARVWLRLVVDERSGRVLRERMATPAHFMRSRYHSFNAPLTIRPPRAG